MKKDLKLLYVEEEGFELLLCASGNEALRKAPHFKPDLILLDVMMPEMDGPTTLKKLRDMNGLGAVPVIFLTAKVHPNEVSEFVKLGSLDVIPKPFDPMQLANQIK